MRKFADDEYLNDDFMKQILTIIIALFAALAAVAQNELVYNESLERLANNGNAVAQNNLGIVYQQGSGVARDLEKAAYWFQKGAENGSAPAMSNLGVAYLKGQGVERNLPLAVQWFEKAAAAGEQGGYFNLATLYFRGVGVTKDYDKAFHYARLALDADPSESFSDKEVNLKTNRLLKGRIQSFMAMCYRQGVGTAPDMQKAMEYMKLAADNDNPEGCLIMSQAYETGDGFPKDLAKAERCYQTAAAGGYFQAQYILGSRYLSGEIFGQNDGLAAKYLGMVVDNKGNVPPMVKADAMLKLADLLDRNGGDADRAAELRSEAAALPAPDPAKIHSLIYD